jgi:hypothetical protein
VATGTRGRTLRTRTRVADRRLGERRNCHRAEQDGCKADETASRCILHRYTAFSHRKVARTLMESVGDGQSSARLSRAGRNVDAVCPDLPLAR